MYRRFNTWKEPVLSRDKEIAREFVQLVWQYYTKERSASFYAGKLRITLPHFCYVIKKTTGMTALDIIANVVIMDAKAQLKSTNLPIKEISIGLGYSNVAFFDKYFRRYVGISPLVISLGMYLAAASFFGLAALERLMQWNSAFTSYLYIGIAPNR